MGNFITLAQGIAMTTLYRDQQEEILAPAYKGQGILPICETFDRSSFEALLGETDCKYIRVYLGMGVDMKVRIIAVGADSNNVDILPSSANANVLGDGGNIVEDAIRCPDLCPPPSALNPG